jgi:hypothetical protein
MAARRTVVQTIRLTDEASAGKVDETGGVQRKVEGRADVVEQEEAAAKIGV